MASILTVSGPSRKIITLDRIAVVMASCLTLFIRSWNRRAGILDSLFMVMASCLTVSVPSRKKAGECAQKQRTQVYPQKKRMFPSRGDK